MTNLFTALAPFIKGSELSFTLKKKGELITVSVMPKGELIDDEDNHIVPLVITGTAEELDKDFVATIIKPVEKAVGIVTNLEEFEASVDKTAEENQTTKTHAPKAAPAKKPEVKKEAAPKDNSAEEKKKAEQTIKKLEEENKKIRKSNFDLLMKKALDARKNADFKSSISLYNEAKDWADAANTIYKQIEEMVELLRKQGFFSEEQLTDISNLKSDSSATLQKINAIPTIEPLTNPNPVPPIVEPAASETNPNPEEQIEPVVTNPTEKGEES